MIGTLVTSSIPRRTFFSSGPNRQEPVKEGCNREGSKIEVDTVLTTRKLTPKKGTSATPDFPMTIRLGDKLHLKGLLNRINYTPSVTICVEHF